VAVIDGDDWTSLSMQFPSALDRHATNKIRAPCAWKSTKGISVVVVTGTSDDYATLAL
jgi:hypothetical protein